MSPHPLLATACLTLLLVPLSGCLQDEGGDAPAPTTPSEEPGAVEVTHEYAGRILYRLGGSNEPDLAYTGDSPKWCIEVPPGTERFAGHMEWSPDQDMLLEFHSPGGEIHSTSAGIENIDLEPPAWLELVDPVAGTWFVYAGPAAFGGMVDWNVTLTWAVPGLDVDPASVDYNEPC